MAANDLENLFTRVRTNLKEHVQLRFKKIITTGNGASDGSTLLSSGITEVNNFWDGAECSVRDSLSNPSRLVETHTSNTLSFTNNTFPFQINSGTVVELGESGTFSNSHLRQFIIDAINYLAGVFPKETLRDYIVTESVGGVNGVADLPTTMIDLHFITIGGKRAIPVNPEEYPMLDTDTDVFLSPTGSSNRFLYLFEGKNSTAGQLKYAPAVNKTVVYHKVPFLSDFDSDKNTIFPTELFDATAGYATYLAFQANEDTDLANLWKATTQEFIQSKSIKLNSQFMQV